MATTKKARKTGGGRTPSGSAPNKSEPMAAAEAKVDEQSKTAETRASAAPKKKVAVTKEWRIILLEGASYSIAGLDFVAGRPLVTTDPKIHELLKTNGRFRIEPVGGG